MQALAVRAAVWGDADDFERLLAALGADVGGKPVIGDAAALMAAMGMDAVNGPA